MSIKDVDQTNMELQEILSVSIGTLVVIVLAHFAVFWVVRTLYPPQVVMVQQPAQQIFTPAPEIIQAEAVQNVTLPTYAPPVPVEAPREEGERRGPPPPEDTSIRGKPGVAASNAQ
jgi:hypothetical protein